MRTCRIAPSILSADFARLGEEVRDVAAAGADWIHFDVMDNHYVPNLTVGPLVLKAIRPYVSIPIDVHLMIEPVDALVPSFIEAGADIITFHPGFGGQSFIESTIEKLARVREKLDAYKAQTGREIALEVDGGVKPANIARIAAAGADTFVAGSAVFGAGSAQGYAEVIRSMKSAVAVLA